MQMVDFRLRRQKLVLKSHEIQPQLNIGGVCSQPGVEFFGLDLLLAQLDVENRVLFFFFICYVNGGNAADVINHIGDVIVSEGEKQGLSLRRSSGCSLALQTTRQISDRLFSQKFLLPGFVVEPKLLLLLLTRHFVSLLLVRYYSPHVRITHDLPEFVRLVNGHLGEGDALGIQELPVSPPVARK